MVETSLPIPGAIRYMPMVLSIRLPLVVETFLPNPGVIRYTLVVMSTRLPVVVKTFLPNPGVIRYTLVMMSTRLPLVVMMCAIFLCMTGRVDYLTSNPREVGYLLVWKSIRLE